MCQYHTVINYRGFILYKLVSWTLYIVFIFLGIFFPPDHSCLFFQINFRVNLFVPKNVLTVFYILIVSNLYITFIRIDMPKRGISLYFLKSTFEPWRNAFQFSSYRFWTVLIKFAPRYFIFWYHKWGIPFHSNWFLFVYVKPIFVRKFHNLFYYYL